MENLSFRQFWAQCFKDAFTRGWKTGGVVNVVLSLIVPFAHSLDAHSGQHLAQWTWVGTYSVALATLGALWLVVAGRLLIYAPYKVYLDNQSKHSLATQELQKQIGDRNVRLLEFDSGRQKKLDLQNIEGVYASLVREGRRLKEASGLPDAFNLQEMNNILAWQQKVEARLRAEIKEGKLLEYEHIPLTGAGGGVFDDDFHKRNNCTKLTRALLKRVCLGSRDEQSSHGHLWR